MLEGDGVEPEGLEVRDRNGLRGSRLLRDAQDVLIDVQRGFGFAVDVDDVADLLQRPEDEERVDEQRKELADGNRLRVDEVQHQEQNAGPEEVHGRALDEAETAQV